MAKPLDVRRLERRGLPARGLELGHVGLGLVALAARRPSRVAAGKKGVRGGHHRDPRRASCGSNQGPQPRRGNRRGAGAAPQSPRLRVWHALLNVSPAPRITNYELRTTNHEPRATNHELRTTNHEPRTTIQRESTWSQGPIPAKT